MYNISRIGLEICNKIVYNICNCGNIGFYRLDIWEGSNMAAEKEIREKGKFKKTDYTLWYWILLSIIVDIAAFAFFDIAFKKEDF